MVENVHNTRGESGHGDQAGAQHHVTDLGYRGKRQQPLDVLFEHRDRGTQENAEYGQRHHVGCELKRMPVQVALEDEEIETQQDIERNLGGTGGQKCRDYVWCESVGIRQPYV